MGLNQYSALSNGLEQNVDYQDRDDLGEEYSANQAFDQEEGEQLADDEQFRLMPFPFIYNIGGSHNQVSTD